MSAASNETGNETAAAPPANDHPSSTSTPPTALHDNPSHGDNEQAEKFELSNPFSPASMAAMARATGSPAAGSPAAGTPPATPSSGGSPVRAVPTSPQVLNDGSLASLPPPPAVAPSAPPPPVAEEAVEAAGDEDPDLALALQLSLQPKDVGDGVMESGSASCGCPVFGLTQPFVFVFFCKQAPVPTAVSGASAAASSHAAALAPASEYLVRHVQFQNTRRAIVCQVSVQPSSHSQSPT